MNRLMLFSGVIVILTASVIAQAAVEEAPRYTFNAVMKSTFSSKPGILKFFSNKILFEAVDRSESHEWLYGQLVALDRKGPYKVGLKTHEHDVKKFGKSKGYTFEIENPALGEDVADWANQRIHDTGSATGGTTAAGPGQIQWPVVRSAEHRHSFGGCEGQLVIDAEIIEFKASEGDHHIRLSYLDIRNVSRESPYHLALKTYKKSAKKLWLSTTLEFTIRGDGVPDSVFEYMMAKVAKNKVEE